MARVLLVVETRSAVASDWADVPQSGRIRPRKLGCAAQLLSNLKMDGRGMEDEMVTTKGTWSEVNLVREVRDEFGKRASHARLKNTRSRVGCSRAFDQV